MRHRLLDAIRLDTGMGGIEMDETSFAESFKGNHEKSKWIRLTPPNCLVCDKKTSYLNLQFMYKKLLFIKNGNRRNGNV